MRIKTMKPAFLSFWYRDPASGDVCWRGVDAVVRADGHVDIGIYGSGPVSAGIPALLAGYLGTCTLLGYTWDA